MYNCLNYTYVYENLSEKGLMSHVGKVEVLKMLKVCLDCKWRHLCHRT